MHVYVLQLWVYDDNGDGGGGDNVRKMVAGATLRGTSVCADDNGDDEMKV